MIKIILAMLAFGFLFACSSAPKSQPNDDASEQEAVPVEQTTTKPTESKMVEMKPVAKSEETTTAPKEIKYDALEAAINANNDERVKSSSIDILQNNPKDIKALNSLAMANYKKGNHEAALLLLNKILSLEPRSSAAYANIGLIYLTRNERREAVEMFKKSLEYNSNNYAAGANLGAIYTAEKDYQKAVLALENSVQDSKADLNTLNNYAIALTATGKSGEAASIYEKILKDQPSNKNTMLNLAILYIEKLNKFDDGLDLINRLKFVGADFESRQVIKDLEIKAKAGLK